MRRICFAAMTIFLLLAVNARGDDKTEGPLTFQVKLETVLEHDDGKFLWFHPRAAAIPGHGDNGMPEVIVTLQKHLHVSDFYSGISILQTDNMGKSWTGPTAIPELDWVREPSGVAVAVADVTPGWHAASGKLIAIGTQVRYSKKGEQLEDKTRSAQTSYSLFDPDKNQWTKWRILEMPADPKFNFARCACAQWLVEPDGSLLLPFYYGPDGKSPFSVMVARCRVEGDRLVYVEHGTEFNLDVVRGLVEPSLIRFGGRYYLTVRNDLKAYVTVSDDGLHFEPLKPWTFDDGTELGSYNTQQHWLAHSDGLFLVYTRRGANNDHIMRHRAPLFIGRVDVEKLQVQRAGETILVPERGATLGNFGAAAITAGESWVTVSEGIFGKARPMAHKRGATGALFVARVIWSRPNRLVAE